MKNYILLLAAILLVANLIQCKEHEESHKRRSHGRRNHQTKSREHYKGHNERGRFPIPIKGHPVPATKYTAPDGSWVADYKLSCNRTVIIAYNATACYYGTWNQNKSLASLYASNETLIGIYNASAAALLVINTSTIQTTIISDVKVHFGRKSTILAAFAKLYSYMLGTGKPAEGQLTANSTLSSDAFFKYLHQGNLTIGFNGSVDFMKSLTANFGNYFSLLQKAFANGASGFGALLTPLFSGVGTASNLISKFFTTIISNGIRLSSGVVDLFVKGIGTGYKTLNATLITLFTNSVKAVGSIFPTISDAIESVISGSGIRNLTSSIINFDKGNVSIVSAITQDDSWLVKIGNPNSTVNVTINYNSKYNIIGFYNKGLKTATVLDGKSGFFAVYNVTSGVGIVVSQNTGNARIVTDYAVRIQKAFKGTLNYTAGFKIIGESIAKKSDGLNDFINLDADVFNFRLVIFFLKSGMDIRLAFFGKDAAYQTVATQFAGLFDAARKYFGNSGSIFNLNLGALNILQPIFGINVLINNFVPLIQSIFQNLSGLFNPRLVINAATTFAKGVASGVQGLQGFIFGALGNALKSAQNFTGGFSAIIDGVLDNLPSGNISIHIKYGHEHAASATVNATTTKTTKV